MLLSDSRQNCVSFVSNEMVFIITVMVYPFWFLFGFAKPNIVTHNGQSFILSETHKMHNFIASFRGMYALTHRRVQKIHNHIQPHNQPIDLSFHFAWFIHRTILLFAQRKAIQLQSNFCNHIFGDKLSLFLYLFITYAQNVTAFNVDLF